MMGIHNLVGVFHAHFTYKPSRDKHTTIFKSLGMKSTEIILPDENSTYGVKQIDLLATKYYVTTNPDEVIRVFGEVAKDITSLGLSGLEIYRTKVEYVISTIDGIEQLPIEQLSDDTYIEIHFKIDYNPSMRDAVLTFGGNNGLAVSDNLLERGNVFFNLRIREGTVKRARAIAAEKLDKILEKFLINNIQVELNIMDTNKEIDRWWA